VYAGYIAVPSNVSANYTFSMDSDDGSQLYIDGQQLINHAGAHAMTSLHSRCWQTPTLTLTLTLSLLQACIASQDTLLAPRCSLQGVMTSSLITSR